MAIIERIGFDTAGAVSSLTALTSTITNTNAAISGLNRTASRTGGLDRAAKSTESLAISWQTLGRVVATQAIVRGINAVTQALGEAAERAGEFEIRTARIANITDEGVAGIDSLRMSFQQLAIETGRSLDEVTEAGLEALQNDLGTTAETFDILAGSADDLAKATGTDLTSSINSLSSVMKSYNLEASEAADIADILFTAYDKGRITMEELESRLGTITPQANTLGISFEEAASAAASLTLSGLNAATALTQYRNIQAKLIKPTEDLQEAFTALGVSTGSELIERFGGLGGALEALRQQFGGNEQAVARAFGTIRGQLGVLNLLANDARNFTGVAAAMSDRLNAVRDAADNVNETTTQQINAQLALLETQTLGVGQVFQEVKLEGLTFVTDLLRGFEVLSQTKAFQELEILATSFGEVMTDVLDITTEGIVTFVSTISDAATQADEFIKALINPTRATEDTRVAQLAEDMQRISSNTQQAIDNIQNSFDERAALGLEAGLGNAFQRLVEIESVARRAGASLRGQFKAAETRIESARANFQEFAGDLQRATAPALFGNVERQRAVRAEFQAISDTLASIQDRAEGASGVAARQLQQELDLQRRKIEAKAEERGFDDAAVSAITGQFRQTEQLLAGEREKLRITEKQSQANQIANQALQQQEQIAAEAAINIENVGTAADRAGKEIQNIPDPSVNTSASIQQMNALRQAALAAAAAVNAANGGGGIVANNGRRVYRQGGGGTRGSDVVPAMLSRGEFVVNSGSTDKFFSQLQAINAGQSPAFREQGGPTNNFGDINVNVSGGAGSESPDQTARQIASGLRRELRRKTSRLS